MPPHLKDSLHVHGAVGEHSRLRVLPRTRFPKVVPLWGGRVYLGVKIFFERSRSSLEYQILSSLAEELPFASIH